MYNSAFKEAYIKRSATKLYLERRFNALFRFTEAFEKAYGKDLSEFTDEEIREIVKHLTDRDGTAQQKIADIKSYIEYSRAAGISDLEQPSDSAFVFDVRSVRTRYFGNAPHLQSVLDIVFEPESTSSIDNIYRLVYWLGFAGMFEADLFCIRCDDVDLKRLEVGYAGHVYRLPREAVRCLRNCVYLETFFASGGRGGIQTIQRCPGRILLRGRTESMSISTLRAILSRKVKHAKTSNTDMHCLTFSDVWASGLFFRMSERERQGIPVDFSDSAGEVVRRKRHPDRVVPDEKSVNRAITSLSSEYERWKDAFRVSSSRH